MTKEELLEKENIYIPEKLDNSILIYLQMGFKVLLGSCDHEQDLPVVIQYDKDSFYAPFYTYCTKQTINLNHWAGMTVTNCIICRFYRVNDLELENICDQIY